MVGVEREGQTPDLRERLLEGSIRPIVDDFVYWAFKKVDRARFVPLESKEKAYDDQPIRIEEGSSISAPTVVAEMIDPLDLTGRERVLEVGTGSGYCAAVLSLCAYEVYTIEYNEELAKEARQRLKDFGYKNVEVYIGDGALGLPNKAPFDAIIVSCGARGIPQALCDQLAEGGRIVVPVGDNPDHVRLVVGYKHRGRLWTRKTTHVRFYPLMSEAHGGWTEKALKEAESAKDLNVIPYSGNIRPRPERSLKIFDNIFGENDYLLFVGEGKIK